MTRVAAAVVRKRLRNWPAVGREGEILKFVNRTIGREGSQ